jgi:hypothetical protein
MFFMPSSLMHIRYLPSRADSGRALIGKILKAAGYHARCSEAIVHLAYQCDDALTLCTSVGREALPIRSLGHKKRKA